MMNPIDGELIIQKKFPTKRKNGLCASAGGKWIYLHAAKSVALPSWEGEGVGIEMNLCFTL